MPCCISESTLKMSSRRISEPPQAGLRTASFSTERRIKEIGIRRVLGASVPSVVALLSGEFTRWVLAANLIAWPAAYGIMHAWLGRFAYRTGPGILVFLLSGAAALLVALLTVSYQSVRAAASDPVDSLRYE